MQKQTTQLLGFAALLLISANPSLAFGFQRERLRMISTNPSGNTKMTLLEQVQDACSVRPSRGLTKTLPPSSLLSPKVRYSQQHSIGSAPVVSGLDDLNRLEEFGEEMFGDDLDLRVQSTWGPIVPSGSDSVVMRWNVTWIPPTSAWLWSLGKVWPGVQAQEISYTRRSGEVSAFSWNAVAKLFRDAVVTKRLRVPLACIEGRSTLRFTQARYGSPPTSNNDRLIESISEEIPWADDLRAGRLRNRSCAADLRQFLEEARRPPGVTREEWQVMVWESLPWSSVPGSNFLDVEPSEEGSGPAVAFLSVAAVIVLLFANALAPEIIGQSLLGVASSHDYVVPTLEFADMKTTYGMF